MTNLKKTLAVVLAFAMILSMGAISTFAYSDVEEGTTVSEAVTILSNLEILTGFEDGTFRPDETVTRAQMAAIICRMLGYEEQAQSSMGTTVFNDVAGDHWASGYVNVAQAQGIINGYGDGNFGPEDKVTYEQAVKMIVSALGYDLAAARKGGYPTGYLAIASSEGITKQANGRVGDAAARKTIAVLVYNALDVQLMDQYSWTTDGSDEYGKIAETVLTQYHDIYKYRGIIENTPVSYVADKGSYDPNATAYATLTDVEELIFSEKGLPVWTDDSDLTAVADKVDVNNYLGKAVILYSGEDQVTGKETIFAITEDESKNDSFKISATQLVEEDEKYWDEEGTIGYKEVGASKVKDISIAEDATVYVNYDGDYSVETTEELAGLFDECGGTVEFISNDADSEYEVIVVIAYEDESVIESVEEEDGELSFDLYTGNEPSDIDLEDEDVLVIVYKDGELATAADLAENDTVAYVEVADNFEMYFASSATVTGTVDSYDTENDVVTIAGEDYEVSAASGLDVKKLSGEEGIFFLNVDGQIAHNETAPTAVGNYTLILAAYEATDGMDKGYYLQVVLADGTLAEYKTSDTAKVYDADGDPIVTNDKDNKDKVYNYFAAKMTEDDDVFKATVADLKADADLMAKITISSNKITKIRFLEGENDSVDAGEEYDAEAMSLGTVDLDENTIVFSVKQKNDEDFVEAEDVVIGAPADFFVDEEEITGDVLVYDADDNTSIFAAAVGFGLTKTIDATSDLFIVTGKKTTTIDDDDAYVLTGVVNGKKTTVTVYDDDAEYTTDPEDVTVGDILLLAEADADGIVSDIYMLVDYDKEEDEPFTATASDANEDDDIYSGIGKVTVSETNKFAIDGDITDDSDTEVVKYEAGTELTYRSSATYTLVDFTENAKNPEVSTKNGGKSLFNVEKYESVAYVRYVDGRMSDVVVYRMAEVD